jgi:hypothetical protein
MYFLFRLVLLYLHFTDIVKKIYRANYFLNSIYEESQNLEKI